MKERIKRFIEKHRICSDRILYIIRHQNKTCIHTSDGRVIQTYFSMKNLLAALDSADLICINKGTAVSCSRIIFIESGIYTMSDGRTLKGRVRTPGEHKRNLAKVAVLAERHEPEEGFLNSNCIAERFSILDKMPIPFAVFELIFDDLGNPEDIIFRYLNHAMEDITDSSMNSVIGKSFYSVFDNGDRKWMEINAEVALTGDSRTIRRFSPELGRYLSLYYYAPMKGYCACALI